jgi:hypothetical protein
MNEKGYKFIHVWVDAEGFPGAGGSKGKDIKKLKLTLGQLNDELARITEGADETFIARLYGELALYARGVRERWDLSRKSPELFKVEESRRKAEKG